MLITFEGIDGSGKSTQARLLVERLQSEGWPAILVREPGGTELSERVRAILLDARLQIEPFAELLLFSAARRQLTRERIKPALQDGMVVVCDRFYDSTTAYQGGGRGVGDLEWLREFHRRVTGGLVPARTFLIELDPRMAVERLAERDRSEGVRSVDRMEEAGLAFQQEVARGYDAIARAEPDRIVRLDGRLNVETLHDLIREAVDSLLRTHEETSTGRSGSPV